MKCSLHCLALLVLSAFIGSQSRAAEHRVPLPDLNGDVGVDPITVFVELPTGLEPDEILQTRFELNVNVTLWTKLCDEGTPDESTHDVQPQLVIKVRDTECQFQFWWGSPVLQEGDAFHAVRLYWKQPPHPFAVCIEDWSFATSRPIELTIWAGPSTFGGGCVLAESPPIAMQSVSLIFSTSSVGSLGASWGSIKALF